MVKEGRKCAWGGSTHLVRAGAGPASFKEEEREGEKKIPSPKSESSSYELPSAHHILCLSPLLHYRMQQIHGATASHSNSFETDYQARTRSFSRHPGNSFDATVSHSIVILSLKWKGILVSLACCYCGGELDASISKVRVNNERTSIRRREKEGTVSIMGMSAQR